MKIGVISDTHGYLDSRVEEIFNGVDRILHAGDVGRTGVLLGLEGIAPTDAVFGNMDNSPVMEQTRERLVLDIDGVRIGLAHGGGSPLTIIRRLREMFEKDNVNIIVYGHTHRPEQQEIDGIYFFNPGDGRKNVGIIETDGKGGFFARIEII